MTKPSIKINYATSDEIAALHGVGKVLANRIVEFRITNGYFKSPDDLDKVEGIGTDFAIMLSAQIDWQVPNPHDIKKEADWGTALYFALIPITMLWIFFNKALPSLYEYIEYYQMGNSELWVWIWIDISLSFAFLSETLRGVALILREVSSSISFSKLFNKAHLFFASTSIFFIISSGLGHATYYQFYSKNGWGMLFDNPGYIIGLLGGFVMVVIFGPQLLVYKYPKLAQNKILAIIFDIGIFISAPGIAYFVWLNRNEFPLWFSIVNTILGLTYLMAGLIGLRDGRSIFYTIVAQWLVSEKAIDNNQIWIKWLNVRLPDPEQQKALKQALESMYPPSKIRTAFSLIVFGAGGWILATVLSSIIDWLLQNWLDKLVR